jgi:hypothetical protein
MYESYSEHSDRTDLTGLGDHIDLIMLGTNRTETNTKGESFKERFSGFGVGLFGDFS